MSIQHGQEALRIGRVAVFDHRVENQATAAGTQIELVAVLNAPAALDDDVGVFFKQTEQLFASGHRLTLKHPALGLIDHPPDQRRKMIHLGYPPLIRQEG